MRITSRKEDEIEKVFIDNAYVGYIENQNMYVFDRNNQSTWIDSQTCSSAALVSHYIRLQSEKSDKEAASLIGFLAAQLACYEPDNATVARALKYLRGAK